MYEGVLQLRPKNRLSHFRQTHLLLYLRIVSMNTNRVLDSNFVNCLKIREETLKILVGKSVEDVSVGMEFNPSAYIPEMEIGDEE